MLDAYDVPAKTKLANVDLNLLTAFRAVDDQRHVTRAAKQLGVSQPALSQSLRRLRAVFGDPLFVRAATGMTLTPFAESVATPIREVLARIESEVLDRADFSPKTLARTFRIRTTDYVEASLGPALLDTLEAEAPLVRFAFQPVGIALPTTELEIGACDLALAGFFEDIPPSFHRQKLFTDVFACAVRKGHPRISKKLSLDAYCEERHVLVAPSGELHGGVDRALAKHRKKRLVVAGSSGFLVGAWTSARSDCIVTAPARLLGSIAGAYDLVVLPPPIDLPSIEIAAVWHARNHADAAHRWFRERVRAQLS